MGKSKRKITKKVAEDIFAYQKTTPRKITEQGT